LEELEEKRKELNQKKHLQKLMDFRKDELIRKEEESDEDEIESGG
jgi:hypothetical protein